MTEQLAFDLVALQLAVFAGATLASYALQPLPYRQAYVPWCVAWYRLARRKVKRLS